jgi:Lhr-like helicase
LRNPLGARRRVGGRFWGERRLFDKVRSADPEFILMRQALGEVHSEACDAPGALRFVEELVDWTIRSRILAQPSPFAQNWSQMREGPAETIGSPAEALEKLHAVLTMSGAER